MNFFKLDATITSAMNILSNQSWISPDRITPEWSDSHREQGIISTTDQFAHINNVSLPYILFLLKDIPDRPRRLAHQTADQEAHRKLSSRLRETIGLVRSVDFIMTETAKRLKIPRTSWFEQLSRATIQALDELENPTVENRESDDVTMLNLGIPQGGVRTSTQRLNPNVSPFEPILQHQTEQQDPRRYDAPQFAPRQQERRQNADNIPGFVNQQARVPTMAAAVDDLARQHYNTRGPPTGFAPPPPFTREPAPTGPTVTFPPSMDAAGDNRGSRPSSGSGTENNLLLRETILETVPGPSYYATLPVPWNIKPDPIPKDYKPRDLNKTVSSLEKHEVLKSVKLKPNVGSYLEWRNMFIQYVHGKANTLSEKSYAMAMAINLQDPQMAPIRHIMMSRTGDIYRRSIIALEDMFGGVQRMIDHYVRRIRSRPSIREDDTIALSSYVADLDSIREAFLQNNCISDFMGTSFFGDVRDKLPRSYFTQYRQWLSIRYGNNALKNQTIYSLVEWMRQKLSDLLASENRDFIAPSQFISSKPRAKSRQFLTVEDENPSEEEFLHDCDEDTPSGFIEGPDDPQPDPDREQVYVSQAWGDLIPICTACGKNARHLYRDCDAFLKMKPQERRDHLRKHNKCFRCLREGHGVKSCKSKIVCKHCAGDHHSLVCQKSAKPAAVNYLSSVKPSSENPPEEAFIQGSSEVMASVQTHVRKPLYKSSLPIVGLKVTNPVNGKVVRLNALIDTGANRSSMSRAAADMIGLKGDPMSFSATGFGGALTQEQAMRAEIIISPLQGTFKYKCQMLCLQSPLGDLVPDDWSVLKNSWPHLKDLDIAPICPDEQVHMIVGTDNSTLLASRSADVIGPDCSPTARQLVFGWVVCGRMYPGQQMDQIAHVDDMLDAYRPQVLQYFCHDRSYAFLEDCYPSQKRDHWSNFDDSRREENFKQIKETYDRDLLELLKKQYQADETPDNEPEMSLEDRYAYRKMKASERHTGERYEVDCLWRKGEPKLIYNKASVVSRFTKLTHNPLYKSTYYPVYEKTLTEYLDKDYIEEVPQEERDSTDSFYLPHFVVSKKTDDSVKYRIVFDGAARYANKSLNDAIAKGPNFIADLVKVLVQFRRSPIALTMDVKEMFLQVQMAPRSRKFHRFVFQWLGQTSLTEYQFTRHPFGNTGSPCIAMFIVRRRAEELRDRYPEAAKIITDYSIIDDVMTSTDTVDQAKKIYDGAKAILGACSMEIHKIASNNDELLAHIPAVAKAKGFDTERFLHETCPTTHTARNALEKCRGRLLLSGPFGFPYRLDYDATNPQAHGLHLRSVRPHLASHRHRAYHRPVLFRLEARVGRASSARHLRRLENLHRAAPQPAPVHFPKMSAAASRRGHRAHLLRRFNQSLRGRCLPRRQHPGYGIFQLDHV
jgi:hypothetical protein